MPASHFICVIIRPYFTDDHSLEMSSWRLLSLFIPTRAQSAPYSWKWDLMGGWVCGWLCSWYVTGWHISDLISLTASCASQVHLQLDHREVTSVAHCDTENDKSSPLRKFDWLTFSSKLVCFAPGQTTVAHTNIYHHVAFFVFAKGMLLCS